MRFIVARFVVTLRLPDFFDEDFISLIPTHRAHISDLIEQTIIETYAISADRTKGWVTINAASAAAVQKLVEKFPLFRFLAGVEIDELFVFDSASARFPQISLN
ncbi:hypothetical protein LJY25_07735 [Hymenobacter sp. BT175]|uniref:hypothetical protein n=1 Tax=Hymenobacter translucens TaxID=2886507 RepID=UPI001D0EB415|nr:hypothetical protein [Hymenobacter translucens]MCC2546331.1 hypothetical protein [Hymenobacter translucens]